MYHVLLYYKIQKVHHPDVQVKLHREVCKALGLTGRILIGRDGINGTVAGEKTSIEMYKQYMNQHPTFKNIDFKESTSEFDPFPKLSLKAREEIITTEDRENFNIENRAKHVDRDEFHQWLVRKEDMVILDMRNDYEWEIGRFVGSVKPPMKYFRDLKENMEFYEQFKDKKIVTFCTGGIRCEPATAMFLQYGFDPKRIYQLDGGIVKYAEKYGNEGFYEGKCFVFDDRIAITIDNTENAKIIGNCLLCDANVDDYRNCLNKFCNKLFIGCDACMENTENTCSDACQGIVQQGENMRSPRRKILHRNK